MSRVIDITIVYPDGVENIWEFMCSKKRGSGSASKSFLSRAHCWLIHPVPKIKTSLKKVLQTVLFSSIVGHSARIEPVPYVISFISRLKRSMCS